MPPRLPYSPSTPLAGDAPSVHALLVELLALARASSTKLEERARVEYAIAESLTLLFRGELRAAFEIADGEVRRARGAR